MNSQEGLPKVFVEWIAPDSPQGQKTKGWYLVMGLVILFFVIYGLLSEDSYSWIISLTFVLMAGVYYFFEMKPKGFLSFQMTDLGIVYAGKFYAYSALRSFWVISEADIRALYFRTFQGPLREFSILIPIEMDIGKIREYLKLQLPEEEGRKESFSDQLIRNLGL